MSLDSRLNILVSEKREKWSTWRKTYPGKDENSQQTQPTYDSESGNRTCTTLVGGECSHHCAIPAAFASIQQRKYFMR